MNRSTDWTREPRWCLNAMLSSLFSRNRRWGANTGLDVYKLDSSGSEKKMMVMWVFKHTHGLLTPEQHRFELGGSTYMWSFFCKDSIILQMYFSSLWFSPSHLLFSSLADCKNTVYNTCSSIVHVVSKALYKVKFGGSQKLYSDFRMHGQLAPLTWFGPAHV